MLKRSAGILGNQRSRKSYRGDNSVESCLKTGPSKSSPLKAKREEGHYIANKLARKTMQHCLLSKAWTQKVSSQRTAAPQTPYRTAFNSSIGILGYRHLLGSFRDFHLDPEFVGKKYVALLQTMLLIVARRSLSDAQHLFLSP